MFLVIAKSHNKLVELGTYTMVTILRRYLDDDLEPILHDEISLVKANYFDYNSPIQFFITESSLPFIASYIFTKEDWYVYT